MSNKLDIKVTTDDAIEILMSSVKKIDNCNECSKWQDYQKQSLAMGINSISLLDTIYKLALRLNAEDANDVKHFMNCIIKDARFVLNKDSESTHAKVFKNHGE